MCVAAVMTVADLERKDVNLDLIKASTFLSSRSLMPKIREPP